MCTTNNGGTINTKNELIALSNVIYNNLYGLSCVVWPLNVE